MRSIISFLIILFFSTVSYNQANVRLTGEVKVFSDNDQLVFGEDQLVYIDLVKEALQIAKSSKVISLRADNGLRIFKFEKEGIYKKIEYTYLLTDDNRNFLAELIFSVKNDGENFTDALKTVVDYDLGYASLR